MASGAPRNYNGSVIGTGADMDVKVVGFRPRKVELFNITGDAVGVWIEGMADDSMMKTTTAAAMVTSNGVTPLADGFSIGADADVNAVGETIVFIASE